MEIIDLKQKYLFTYSFNRSSFLIKLKYVGCIWLFNCCEGCQHVMAKNKIKISQIVKIIITDLTVNNISGLFGLLSSLSLHTQIHELHVYGPRGLDAYLLLGRKYSQTNFRYRLSVHIISIGLIFQEDLFSLYASIDIYDSSCFDYSIVISEIPGRFNLSKAANYKIPLGPLYGQLKINHDFVMPDGYILYGTSFTQNYNLGPRVNFALNGCTRSGFEALHFVTYNLDK